jgi:hypothetical protein
MRHKRGDSSGVRSQALAGKFFYAPELSAHLQRLCAAGAQVPRGVPCRHVSLAMKPKMTGLRDEKKFPPRPVFPNHEMASTASGVTASGGSQPA